MTSLTIVLLMLSLQAVIGSSLGDLEKQLKKCSPPKQLEGKFKLTFISPEEKFTGKGTIHVDYTTRKAFVTEKVIVNQTSVDYSHYMMNNLTYSVSPTRKQCYKQNFEVLPFTVPAGVPLKIKRGEVQGVRVQIWEFSFNKGMGTQTFYVTEGKCVFVKAMVKTQDICMIHHYYGMQEGIKDTSVFDLPKYCVRHGYYSYFFSQDQIQV